ncbi:hypothetical protein Sjap_024748 [Stephania japonica]|uniref:Uncharacterized protein n=1 Tax=Stephania japonica TaxID=461633 RepID=A0AAP0EDX5_9MAGN
MDTTHIRSSCPRLTITELSSFSRSSRTPVLTLSSGIVGVKTRRHHLKRGSGGSLVYWATNSSLTAIQSFGVLRQTLMQKGLLIDATEYLE